MSYLLEKSIWSNIFAVPCEVVDQHIKLCGETALKVLLVLLRRGGDCPLEELARLVGHSEQDVGDALSYWKGAGVLAAESSEQSRTDREQNAAQDFAKPPLQEPAPLLQYVQVPEIPTADKEKERKVKLLSSSRAKLTTGEINAMAKEDESIAYLLQESQSVLGRPLTPVATDTLVSLYSYYGMQPDLVLMLLQYCVTIGKDNMRYIEKVAATWLEKGVDSHERAEEEILRATESSAMEHKIKTAFGIYDRKLVASEQKYIQIWVGDYHYDLDLITLAFERAVEQKGKLSFPYINGILTNWFNKGVTTPAQALQEMQNKPGTGARQTAPSSQRGGRASYDMDELERMIDRRSILD